MKKRLIFTSNNSLAAVQELWQKKTLSKAQQVGRTLWSLKSTVGQERRRTRTYKVLYFSSTWHYNPQPMDKGPALLCELKKLFLPFTAPQAAWTTRHSHFGRDGPRDPVWSSFRNSFRTPKSLPPLTEQPTCIRALNEEQTWGFFTAVFTFSLVSFSLWLLPSCALL